MLSEIENTAIAKATKPSKELTAGKHEVDVTIRIQGTITKGEDYSGTVYQSVPFDRMFAVAMSKLNSTTIEAIMREALSDNAADLLERIKPQAQAAIQTLTQQTEKIQNGKTTAKLKVTKIETLTLK